MKRRMMLFVFIFFYSTVALAQIEQANLQIDGFF